MSDSAKLSVDAVLGLALIVGSVVAALWFAYRRPDYTKALRKIAALRGGAVRDDILHLVIDDLVLEITIDEMSVNAIVDSPAGRRFWVLACRTHHVRAVLRLLDMIVAADMTL